MGAPPDKVWPRSDIRYLTKHYHVVAVGKIAEHLGRTKSSIIGMAHRLGLSVNREEISRRMSEGMRANRPEPKRKRKKKRSPQQFVKPPQPPPAPVVSPHGITLLTLRDGQCKFPIGRKKVRIIDVKHDLTAFCGQPVDISEAGRVYCPHHMKLAYDRVRTRASEIASWRPPKY